MFNSIFCRYYGTYKLEFSSYDDASSCLTYGNDQGELFPIGIDDIENKKFYYETYLDLSQVKEKLNNFYDSYYDDYEFIPTEF